MDEPPRKVVGQLAIDLIDTIWLEHFRDLPFVRAYPLVRLAIEIWLADHAGNRANVTTLARRFGMQRSTIYEWLDRLERRGYLLRSGRGLRINPDKLSDDAIERMASLIRHAAGKLP